MRFDVQARAERELAAKVGSDSPLCVRVTGCPERGCRAADGVYYGERVTRSMNCARMYGAGGFMSTDRGFVRTRWD